MSDQSYNDACVLYGALENMLGDWYLFSLGEINRDAINEGSARDAMKVLKRLQQYRAGDMQPLAIGQKRDSTEKQT